MDNKINNLVSMGYICDVVGIKGWLKLKSNTEYKDGLLDYLQWWIGNEQSSWKKVSVEQSKLTNKGLQVKFKGIDDRNTAETLKGMTIAVRREDFALTANNEYYWVDLLGLEVYSINNEKLGEVSGLMESGAHDILIVHQDEKQILIPFVEQFIVDVNLEKRRIQADWQADYAC